MLKNLPAMQETLVQSLGWENPLEKGMSPHSSIPWTEEPGGLQSMGLQRVGHNRATNTHSMNQYQFTNFSKCTTLLQDINNRKLKVRVGEETYRNSIFHTSFINLKLLPHAH